MHKRRKAFQSTLCGTRLDMLKSWGRTLGLIEVIKMGGGRSSSHREHRIGRLGGRDGKSPGKKLGPRGWIVRGE